MPPLRFNHDLLEAQNAEITHVSDIQRGDDYGALRFTYRHDSLVEPAVIQMISHGKPGRKPPPPHSTYVSAV